MIYWKQPGTTKNASKGPRPKPTSKTILKHLKNNPKTPQKHPQNSSKFAADVTTLRGSGLIDTVDTGHLQAFEWCDSELIWS
jgi:hypothetical protein